MSPVQERRAKRRKRQNQVRVPDGSGKRRLVVPTNAQDGDLVFSPYRIFTRADWARLRADTPMTLLPDELEQLSGIIEELSVEEVEQIYLPLSRLLNLYVAALQKLHAVTTTFLGRTDGKVPFIIGVAGSVAVGKSTTARVLKALLARWPDHPRVDLITTDGFLLPNAELQSRGIMNRKGFPESFDTAALLTFLADVKSGKDVVEAPVYSHFHYDILPDQKAVLRRPDILIVEGLNVLQPARLPKDGAEIPFVSDFFDFSIYLDADAAIIEEWYLERFMRLRSTAFRDPGAYFHKYAGMSPDEAKARALELWSTINARNLRRKHSADASACPPHLAQDRRPSRRVGRPSQTLIFLRTPKTRRKKKRPLGERPSKFAWNGLAGGLQSEGREHRGSSSLSFKLESTRRVYSVFRSAHAKGDQWNAYQSDL